jgi:hypothetical protein
MTLGIQMNLLLEVSHLDLEVLKLDCNDLQLCGQSVLFRHDLTQALLHEGVSSPRSNNKSTQTSTNYCEGHVLISRNRLSPN